MSRPKIFSDEEIRERKRIRCKKYYYSHPETHNKWALSHPEEKRKLRKNWFENHPGYKAEHNRKYIRKNLYKISEEDYSNFVLVQEGKCAICGKDNRGRALCIDHNHVTAKVRGLLCHECNAALGFAYDDVNLLEKMITYLKERD